MNRRRTFQVLTAIALFVAMVMLPAVASAKSDDEERSEIRADSQEALNRLYAARPEARAAVEGAAGYATFSNFGLKLGIAGGGRGRGVAVTSSDDSEVFMRFVEVQAGIGLGIKKFDLIFVFENAQALNDFIDNGWEAGAQATAAATRRDRGASFQGAASVSPGVWLYQVTETGLAAELTVKGTRYYKDRDLN